MQGFSLPEAVGWSAVGVVLATWLVVSFARGDRARLRASWLGATALYLALATLFSRLFQRAWSADQTAVYLAFGFLLLLFTSGCVVSLIRTLASLRPGKGPATGSGDVP